MSKYDLLRTLEDLNKHKIDMKMAAFITFIDDLFDNSPKILNENKFKR